MVNYLLNKVLGKYKEGQGDKEGVVWSFWKTKCLANIKKGREIKRGWRDHLGPVLGGPAKYPLYSTGHCPSGAAAQKGGGKERKRGW